MVKNRDTRTRRLTNITENLPIPYELQPGLPGQLLTQIDVLIRGSVTLGAGGGTSGTSQGENPGGIVDTLIIDADAIPGGCYRGGQIKKLTARTALRRGIFDVGKFRDDLIGPISGAAATFPLNLRIPLRFALPRMKSPYDLALRLDQFSQVLLGVNMSSIANLLTGNNRTVDFTALIIDIVEYRTMTIDSSKPTGYWPAGTLFDDDILVPIPGANAEFTLDSQLPKTESYFDLLLMTQSTNKALVDTILNRATIYTGQELKTDLYADEIRMQNQDDLTTDDANAAGNGNAKTNTSLLGTYYFNFARGNSGVSKQGLITNAITFPTAILNVSDPAPGADSLRVASRRFATAVRKPPATPADLAKQLAGG